MTDLETLIRIGLDDLADEVRPVDLRSRVAATRQRRRNRIRVVAVGVAAAVAASAVGVVTLWPDPVEEEPDIANRSDSWLPDEIDLSTAVPVQADASLRMIFQVDDGALRSYGLVAGSDDLVVLPELPEFGHLWHTRLSADGSRALVHDHADDTYNVVDTRTGVSTQVPWQDDYRTAGLSPDGQSVAVATLATTDPNADPPLMTPWGLTIIDLATSATRPIALPEWVGLEGISSDPSAGSPVWSPDGTSVALDVGPTGQVQMTVVVSIDGASAWTPRNAVFGVVPWSPDSTRLLVESDAENAYRVIVAESATTTQGDLLASGPTYGRDLLGWASDDRLLWFDPGLSALVETDLGGALIGPPASVTVEGEVTSVLLAPVADPD